MPVAKKPRIYALSEKSFSSLLTIHSLLDGTACGLIGDNDKAHTQLPISRVALGRCFAYYAQQLAEVLSTLPRSRIAPSDS